MNHNVGICYLAPDFMMKIKDFMEHIQLGIQTVGYEEMKTGDNLMICVIFMGRITVSGKAQHKTHVKSVVTMLGSKHVDMIEPIEISSEENAGKNWDLSKFFEKPNTSRNLIPKNANYFTNSKGEMSIRFNNYEKGKQVIDFTEEDQDE